jgi:hypothetical protein
MDNPKAIRRRVRESMMIRISGYQEIGVKDTFQIKGFIGFIGLIQQLK